jgi:hypothetical protein
VKNAKHKAWCLKHSAPNIGIKKQPKRGLLNITRFNIKQDSGLCVADFEFFYNQLVSVNTFFGRIGQMYGSRTALQCSNGIGLKTMQTPRVRLLMVFYWLCEKPKIRILGEKFGVSASTAMRKLKNLLPKLIVATRGSISWPRGNLPSWMGAIGCIDCTAHLRTRVHPRQAEWYRRDKGVEKHFHC